MTNNIKICMGSACYALGNDKNLAIVESYIEEHNLQAKIELYGARCENMCDKGPNIEINGEIIALDGSGFTNDYADKYYAIIRRKERKSYVKNHISIEVDHRLILHYAAQ
jgi:NADH:ubiquinone oxidoreductase subunit E